MSNAQQALPALEGYSFTYLTSQELPLVQTLCQQCAREIEQTAHLQPGLSLEHVLGFPPGPSMAQELALALPAGKGSEDKLLMGIFARPEQLVGVLDAIRDYPVQGEWWLGLLMLEPAQRGRGLGEKICRAFEQWAKDVGARYLRLVVSVQNRRGYQFGNAWVLRSWDNEYASCLMGKRARLLLWDTLCSGLDTLSNGRCPLVPWGERGKVSIMMGKKERHFAPLIRISLEELVPQDHFYRHLERTLNLSFVREFVEQTYAFFCFFSFL